MPGVTCTVCETLTTPVSSTPVAPASFATCCILSCDTGPPSGATRYEGVALTPRAVSCATIASS